MRRVLVIAAVFLVAGIGVELLSTYAARSWEPRRVWITRNDLVHDNAGTYVHIGVRDIQSGQEIPKVRPHFGPQAAYYYVPFHGYESRTHDAFPVGMELTAYRNPLNHAEYILQQTGLSWFLITLGIGALIWVGWNAYRTFAQRHHSDQSDCWDRIPQ